MLRGITQKINGEFYYQNHLHSIGKKTNIITISKYQYHKYDKGLLIIYADLECMIERLMDIKIILKIHSHQSRWAYTIIKLQYHHLKT